MDGNYYGTSRSGGAYGHGTIYRVGSDGALSVMVHFTGTTGAAKGRRPQSALVDDGTGNLWGTTFQGGAGNLPDGFGTVFKFNPTSRSFSTVVQFTGAAGFAKGSFPQAGLALDGQGQLWGATTAGGSGASGTVFKVNPVTLTFTSVLDFTGTPGESRGRTPQAGLVFDGTGLLWGTTVAGGSGGFGTLFTVNSGTEELKTVFDFTGADGSFSGSRPLAALLQSAPGIWWGTTSAGGLNGHGTVFRYTSAVGVFESVASFTGTGGAFPGRLPSTVLVPDGAGSLLGTTNSGGTGDYGTSFKINANSLTFNSLSQFTGNGGEVPGSTPSGGLTPDGAGALIGVTAGGGASRLGTVFRLNPVSGAHTSVVDFVRTLGSASASNPLSGLTAGPDGMLWGTSSKGGRSNAGTLFSFNPVTGETATVLEFTGSSGVAKGADPAAELVSDGQGNLWGTTLSGGASDVGVVFKINLLSRVYTPIVEFSGGNGRNPAGRLVLDGNGFFWGTTGEGGNEFSGTIFKIHIGTGALTTVVHFDPADGDGPLGGLTADGQGFFWGTTYEGGENNLGTIFKVAAATGAFTRVLSFTGSEGDFKGDGPSAAMVLDAQGFLHGTTGFGGLDGLGTVFKINRLNGVFTTIAEFTGVVGNVPGANPRSSLIQDPTGAWYGTTEAGGSGDLGTVFKITPTGTFQTVTDFTGSGGDHPGEKPRGALWRHSDGHFYGLTSTGGALDALTPAGNGQIYRLRLGPISVTTASATGIESSSATLLGSLNPNGAVSTFSFEYGTQPGLAGAKVLTGASATSAGSGGEAVSAALSGLLPSTVYYYRLRALNAENPNLQLGGILSFTTGASTGTGNPGFAAWLNAAGITGGAAEAGLDADLDGTANAMEFVLGGAPGTADFPAGASMSMTAEHLVFTFRREDRSETPDVSLSVEAGADVASWAESWRIRADTASSDAGVTVEENGAEADLVTVTIPKAGSRTKFARLRVLVSP